MKSEYVVDLYTRLENIGIKIWIDGGWAVDALIGKVTRSHSDLDIAIENKNVKKFRKFTESIGYKEIERDEDKKWDFVLADSNGHELDVHVFSFDDDGDVIEEKDEWAGYSKKSLTGNGIIGSIFVRCVSFEQLIKTHDESMRTLKEKDREDMKNLVKYKNMQLIRATIEDIKKLLEIEETTIGIKVYSRWKDEKEMRERLDNEVVYFIKNNGSIVGSVSYEIKNKTHAEFSTLVIRPEFQRRGLAKQAMSLILEELKDFKKITLEVHPENHSAKLYESFGFKIESHHESYYDGEPRLIMVKQQTRKS